jgi:hypothetical protein
MKLFTGAAFAALVVAAAPAHAQVAGDARGSYSAAADIDEPYAGMPPPVPAPEYGYEPSVLPPDEVYGVLRENGFSPLGAPHLRGYVYTIAAIDPSGEDGRLVIDARSGRILRFVPAYRMGPGFHDGAAGYGLPGAMAPILVRGVPRPPAPIPNVASRTVPVPRPSPRAAELARPAAAEPAQQAAAVQPKPPEPAGSARPGAPTTVGQAPPAAFAILPTQKMPPAQGLE